MFTLKPGSCLISHLLRISTLDSSQHDGPKPNIKKKKKKKEEIRRRKEERGGCRREPASPLSPHTHTHTSSSQSEPVSRREIGTFLRWNKHWSFHSFIDLIITKKRTQGKENKHQEINVEDSKDTETTPIHPKEGEIKREKGKNRVSLAHNGSQGGNGLLHLVYIHSGEFEHRGDRGLLGELQFLQGLVSGLHLNQQSQSK